MIRSNSRAVCGPMVSRPVHHARGRPFQMRLVGSWAVLGNGDGVPMTARTQVGSHALAFVEDLDGGGRRADFHQLLHQVVGHAVEVRVEGDVVVDVDPGAGPLAQIERLGRQRIQSGFVESRELRRPRAFALAERPLVDAVAQLADGLVQFLDARRTSDGAAPR